MEGKKALVADDDPALLRLLEYCLGRLGLSVSLAADGPAALDCFTTEEPDIIILDVMMPGMCGWDVCRRIRETSSTPVLMISAGHYENERERSLECGANAHLRKPLLMRELAQQVARFLGANAAAP